MSETIKPAIDYAGATEWAERTVRVLSDLGSPDNRDLNLAKAFLADAALIRERDEQVAELTALVNELGTSQDIYEARIAIARRKESSRV